MYNTTQCCVDLRYHIHLVTKVKLNKIYVKIVQFESHQIVLISEILGGSENYKESAFSSLRCHVNKIW